MQTRLMQKQSQPNGRVGLSPSSFKGKDWEENDKRISQIRPNVNERAIVKLKVPIKDSIKVLPSIRNNKFALKQQVTPGKNSSDLSNQNQPVSTRRIAKRTLSSYNVESHNSYSTLKAKQIKGRAIGETKSANHRPSIYQSSQKMKPMKKNSFAFEVTKTGTQQTVPNTKSTFTKAKFLLLICTFNKLKQRQLQFGFLQIKVFKLRTENNPKVNSQKSFSRFQFTVLFFIKPVLNKLNLLSIKKSNYFSSVAQTETSTELTKFSSNFNPLCCEPNRNIFAQQLNEFSKEEKSRKQPELKAMSFYKRKSNLCAN